MTSTQVAVLTPVLVLVIVGVIQAGLWWHAQQAAQAAAEMAADRAAAVDAVAADGQAAGMALLDAAGNVADPVVSVSRGDDVVVADVSGTAPSLLPGIDWSVTARAVAPTERFRPEVPAP